MKNVPPIKYGKEHWAWKGNDVGYFALHSWINRQFGKAIRCDNRERRALNFPCRGISNNFEWCSKSREYKRKKNDWIALCRSCHRLYDMTKEKLEKLKVNGKKGNLIPHSGWFKKGQKPWNKTRIFKKCTQCHKKFRTIESDLERRKTCSFECRNLSYKKHD